jgi:hypothetical protein
MLVAASFAVYAQQGSPRMVSADPVSGKVGDVITITGENLQKEMVAKVFLTDEKNDIQCEVTEQSGTVIKFKIPAKATGKLAVMVLTGEKEAKLIEQPVKVTVE